MSFINKLAVGCAVLLLALAALLVVACQPVSVTWTMTCTASGTYDPGTGDILTGTITGNIASSGNFNGDLSGEFAFEATYNEADGVWYGTGDEENLESGTLTVDGVPREVEYFADVTPSNFVIGAPGYPEPSSCSFDITGDLAVATTGEPYIVLGGTISGTGSGTWSMPLGGEWGDWELTGASASGTDTWGIGFGEEWPFLGEPAVECGAPGSRTVSLFVSPELIAELDYEITSEGCIFLAKYESNPTNTPVEGSLDAYIEVDSDISSDDINWDSVQLRVYYTAQEVSDAGIVESTLKMKSWDGTKWVEVDSGVNTEGKFVWADLDSFSPKVPWGEPSVDGCFIATAAYGSYMDSSVETLRSFRDQYLVTNPLGQGLVSVYYKLSPPVAEFIDDYPALKPIVRAALLPAVAMGAVAVNTTLAEKMAIVGSLALISIALAMWTRKRRSRGLHYSSR